MVSSKSTFPQFFNNVTEDEWAALLSIQPERIFLWNGGTKRSLHFTGTSDLRTHHVAPIPHHNGLRVPQRIQEEAPEEALFRRTGPGHQLLLQCLPPPEHW